MSETPNGGPPRLLHADAYRLGADGQPRLKGVRCACGHVGFPYQVFGCERCGSLDLQPVDLTARGVIAACAVVPMILSAGPPPPFAVASVLLEEGPMVRVLLVGLGLGPGDTVEGVMVSSAAGNEGDETLDLRFGRPSSAGGA